jgi:aminoglycoside/choline kinase family phosphotransferase
MPGGASTRRYYRLTFADSRSAIGMYTPEATKSEEIGKSEIGTRRWPFLEIQELLAERQIAVPKVFGEACASGFVLLEDLSDNTLAEYLRVNPARNVSDSRNALACSMPSS